MKTPRASRPHIHEYGIPSSEEGMLSWCYVQERMRASLNYWISTASPTGQPHATPVWGVWMQDILYFDGNPQTRRGRDLAANPKVSVHLEDGTQVVFLEGEAHEIKNRSQRCARRFRWPTQRSTLVKVILPVRKPGSQAACTGSPRTSPGRSSLPMPPAGISRKERKVNPLAF